MHIIRNAVGIVENGRTTLEFDVGDEWVKFEVAKDVADETWLGEEAAIIKAGEGISNHSARADLTSKPCDGMSGGSYLRGFQGGLVHLVKMGNERYLLTPLRGADARSSKLQLDIQAGRQKDETDGTWPEVILRYGFEIGMVAPGNKILIPSTKLFKGYGGLADVVRHGLAAGTHFAANWDYGRRAMKTNPTRYGEQEINVRLVDLPGAATFVVNDGEGSEQYSFKAGWAALPWASSIEAIQVVEWEVPEGTRFYDTQAIPYDGPGGEQPLDRKVYLIPLDEGDTRTTNATSELTRPLSTLLSRNKKRQRRLQRAGEFANSVVDPISPKLRAAAEYLGVDQHPGLQPLLRQY